MIQHVLKAWVVAVTIQGCFAMEEQEPTNTQQNEAPYSFKFLTERYPELIVKAQEDFQHYEEEEAISYKQINSRFFEMAKQVFATSIFDARQLEAMYGVNDQRYRAGYETQINAFLNQLPNTDFFQVLKKRKASPKNIFEDILLASEFIYEHIKQQEGDNSLVIALGRSPCVPFIAYQSVLKIKECKTQRAVHLNFSGNPDMDVLRDSSFYTNHPDVVRVRNMVTPEKLKHYLDYMDSKDLLNAKKIYILDIIGKGGGLNSFLKILKCYFSNKNVPLPSLEFLCLNLPVDLVSRGSFKYQKTGIGKGSLQFLDNTNENFTTMEIPTQIVPVADLTVTLILDNDLFQTFGSFGIEYPAQKWTMEYDQERTQGGIYSKNIASYLEQNLNAYIKHHLKLQTPAIM